MKNKDIKHLIGFELITRNETRKSSGGRKARKKNASNLFLSRWFSMNEPGDSVMADFLVL